MTADKENLKLLLKKLEGKTIQELVKEGSKSLASMPSGGSGAAAAAGPATEAAPAEKEKEEEPEDQMEMGDLFGGDDDDY